MASTGKPADGSGRSLPRAKKACQVCNSRRIRCNAMEKQPCRNCEAAGLPCELMKSKRGRYPRHVNGSRISAQPPTSYETSRKDIVGTSTDGLASITQDMQEHTSSNSEQILTPQSQETVINYAVEAQAISSFRPGTSRSQETDRALYLGESNSLGCVADEGRRELPEAINSPFYGKKLLCYPISDSIRAKISKVIPETSCSAEQETRLNLDGCFSFPAPYIQEVILHSYFTWFHPCFPIVDRVDISRLYVSKTISPLLLHAMLFIGASLTDEGKLHRLGFDSQHKAKYMFYNHAKDLYHADWETNKIIVIQALFLMSFYRAGPYYEKDTRHWLGSAICLAQTKGFHRESRFPHLNPDLSRLRKRIWWSLYVRDRQCSASLGLPTRIRDDDCDIEMPEPCDFEEDGPTIRPDIFGSTEDQHISYMIQTAKLARLLGKIVFAEFAPRKIPADTAYRSKLNFELLEWESDLPPDMKLNSNMDTESSIWVNMLHMAYNYLFILLYRSTYIGASHEMGVSDGSIALQAACRNTRMIEDMLSQELLHHGQLHLITNVFAALCIHTISVRRSVNTAKKLAEHRAQICLLGLKELQKSWDISNWILQLFFQLLDELTATNLHIKDFEDTTGALKETRTERSKDVGRERTSSFQLREELSALGPNQVESIDNGLNSEDFFMHSGQFSGFDMDSWGDGFQQFLDSTIPRMDGPDTDGLDQLSGCI